MKKSRNKIFFFIVLAMIFSLIVAGCGKDEKEIEAEGKNSTKEENQIEPGEKDSAAKVSPVEIPEQLNESINGVRFDVKPEVPDSLELDKIKRSTAERQIPDLEQAMNITAEGKNIEEESRDKAEGENGAVYDKYYAKYEDGSVLSAGMTMTYSTPFFEKIHNSFRVEEADKYSGSEVAFQSPEQCFQEIQKILNQVGYESEGYNYEYYALDYHTLQQEEVQMDKTGETLTAKSMWSDEDDCYYFYIEQVQDGLPVYFGEQDFPQDSLENRPIQAVYSKNGLERLDVSKLYTFHTANENVKLMDFGEIARKVADKYGNILTGAEYTVKRAKLYQMPVKTADGKYDVKVVWFFETMETGIDSETGENFEYSLYTCIDAETGEEVSI